MYEHILDLILLSLFLWLIFALCFWLIVFQKALCLRLTIPISFCMPLASSTPLILSYPHSGHSPPNSFVWCSFRSPNMHPLCRVKNHWLPLRTWAWLSCVTVFTLLPPCTGVRLFHNLAVLDPVIGIQIWLFRILKVHDDYWQGLLFLHLMDISLMEFTQSQTHTLHLSVKLLGGPLSNCLS